MKLTYKQLEIEFVKTKIELSQTKIELRKTTSLLKKALEQISLMQKEISDLKDKLNKNSKNSSKPPSTDQKLNLPSQSSKKRKGHKGITRFLFPKEKIDKTIKCIHEKCPHCGSKSIKELSIPEILQQIELPEAKAIITEYILKKYQCLCCNSKSFASLPKGVPNSAFGPKLMGLIATLTGVFHLAKREAIQLITDLYEIDIGLGSIPNIEERVSNALDPIYHRIHNFILKSKYTKHFDETGWRDSGNRNFAWITSCSKAAFYFINKHRNREVFKKLIKKEDLKRMPAVTDRYAVYNIIGKNHQYCFAHLIRDFKFYAERDGPDKKIGESLENKLRKICKIHRRYKKGKISLKKRNRLINFSKKRVKFWLEHGDANGSEKLYKLCEKLLCNFERLWVFLKIPDMDPTNNLAERDLRKLVIWRKKSYGTRSNRGKRFVERITTVSQTLRKNKKNVLKFIQNVIISFYKSDNLPLIDSEISC